MAEFILETSYPSKKKTSWYKTNFGPKFVSSVSQVRTNLGQKFVWTPNLHLDDLLVSSVSTSHPADLVTSYFFKMGTVGFFWEFKKYKMTAISCYMFLFSLFWLVHGFFFGDSRPLRKAYFMSVTSSNPSREPRVELIVQWSTVLARPLRREPQKYTGHKIQHK